MSRLHIVAIATLGTLTFGLLLTGRYAWVAAAATAVDWLIVNLLNRVVDLEEDEANGIVGTGWARRHRRAILATGAALLCGTLVAVHLVRPSLTPLRLGYHLLGAAYNWPLLPGGTRLKSLYFFKNFASAVGFLLTVFGYPLAAAGWTLAGGDVSALTALVAVAFFLPFELSYEVIYDLRDATGDAAAGIRSYPVVHGERGAARIIDGLIGASLAALGAGAAAGVVPWRLLIMGAAPLIQLAVYKRALGRGVTSADCVGITWLGAALLLVWHVWLLADLPGSRL